MLAIVLSLVAVALALMAVFIAVQAQKKKGGAGDRVNDGGSTTHGDMGCASDSGGGGCDGGGGGD
ncbi:hypothetical protein LJR168_001074 [Pseudoxanthomonas sp. LjRoot168]|uniref:hypothetical protein n=1 Tax=unclassified Pseudoxanthomonas TaxID=2645906 RepID=UPI0025CE9A71|nr:hypothetical protein [Pseudoxanthomonas sp.]